MKAWPNAKVTIATEKLRKHIEGKKIALMVNNTATTDDGRALMDVIPSEWDTEVLFFFGMEHGVRGNMYAADANIGSIDEKTGLTVVNLYEYPGLRPPVEWIKKVDAVVFCAQDTGVRHWTYTPWMMFLMDEAAKAGREVIVLDRPNPIRGDIVEGAPAERKYAGKDLLCGFEYPLRHGMTIGELALMYNDVRKVGAKLTVLPMDGWKRSMWWDETGLMWLPPSPNIPTADSPLFFAATGLLQASMVSYGIGTTTPFQYVGAPWVNGDDFTGKLNELGLPGVYLVQKYYKSKLGGDIMLCDGAFITVFDRDAFRPVTLQLNIIDILSRDYGDKLDICHHRLGCIRMCTDKIFDACNGRGSVSDIIPEWEAGAEEFAKRRVPYLLY